MSKINTLTAIITIFLGTGAWANEPTRTAHAGVTTSATASQLNKEIGLVDLYLGEGVNNAKLLANIADVERSPEDKAIVAEARQNLDLALDRGLAHVQKSRTLKTDLKRAAGDAGRLSQLDELDKQLREAKSSLKRLSAVEMTELATAVDGIATHLMGADAAFRDVAKWTNYTRLASTTLGTIPVRGDELRTHDSDWATDKKPGVPRLGAPPSNNNMTPVRTPPPGSPPTPMPEPVQPAPGSRPPL